MSSRTLAVTLRSLLRQKGCKECQTIRKGPRKNGFCMPRPLSRGYCSTPSPSQTPTSTLDKGEARSIDPVGTLQSRLMYFDTHLVVSRLKHEGFSEEQALAVKDILSDVLQNSIEHQAKNMVTKPQLEITVQQLMSHLSSIKKDMVILEKSEFSQLKNETEKLGIELAHLKSFNKNEMEQLKTNVRLDINLERNRATEAHAENEKQLQLLHNKIDTETANLRTLYERNKNDTIKYFAGFVVALGTLTLGILRFMI